MAPKRKAVSTATEEAEGKKPVKGKKAPPKEVQEKKPKPDKEEDTHSLEIEACKQCGCKEPPLFRTLRRSCPVLCVLICVCGVARFQGPLHQIGAQAERVPAKHQSGRQRGKAPEGLLRGPGQHIRRQVHLTPGENQVEGTCSYFQVQG